MLSTISSVMHSTVKDSENRMARVMYKLAVETSKLSHVIAYSHGVDEIIVVTELVVGMVFLMVNKKAAYAVWGAVIWCGVSYLAWSVRYMEKNGKNREDNN